jgi:GNAT superfamily N-acetyltransferase
LSARSFFLCWLVNKLQPAKENCTMHLKKVDDNKSASDWLQVPGVIYSGDPNYIPHIMQDIAGVFNPAKNKLFAQGDAARWILFDDNNRPAGRIAAFFSGKYSDAQKQKTGGIGFFECIDHEDAAELLLQTAVDWLKALEVVAIDGPINFGEKEAYWGLLIENFTDMGSFRMNYNPPYYKRFFENFGFQIYYEQLCYKRDLHMPAQEVFVRKSQQLLQDKAFRVGNARGRSLEQIALDFVTIYNAAWAVHEGFKPMKIEQARKAIQAMRPIMDRDIMVFVYDGEKPIGFYINLPEVNEFMQYVRGNMNALGMLRFLFYKMFGKRKVMVGIVFGVDKEYHGRGVEGAMIKYCEEHIVTLNRYHETILTWIGDFNPKMIHIAENLGASLYRKLATYRLYLDKSRPFERHPML